MGDAAAPQRWIGPADFVTAIRIPLAIAFPLVPDWRWRLAFVAVAGFSDLIDGAIARRIGPSRIGEWLDPVADKCFMLSAFVTLVAMQAREVLTMWELALVLLRDFAAIGAFFVTIILKAPFTVPARLPGKLVTTGQFLVLVWLVLHWPYVRPLAWATGIVGLIAIFDYHRAGRAAYVAASATRDVADG